MTHPISLDDPDTVTETESQLDTEPDTDLDPDPDTANDTSARTKLLDLSVTQLLGGSAAAATAAALGSRLGVVGTIAGAAVLSVISAVAASLYTGSMARARDAVVLVRSKRGDLEIVRESRWRRPDPATTRRVLATTGVVFVIAAAFLAGLQLSTGAQVTGTNLGGRTSAGATVDPSDGTGTGSGGSADSDTDSGGASPATTPTVPVTPSEAVTDRGAGATASPTDTGASPTSGPVGATTGAPDPSTPATPATATSTATTADPAQP